MPFKDPLKEKEYRKNRYLEQKDTPEYKEARKKYYLKNRDKLISNTKKWIINNKEKRREYDKNYRINHPNYRLEWIKHNRELHNQQQRVKYSINIEERRKYAREYYHTRRHIRKAYYEKNKKKILENKRVYQNTRYKTDIIYKLRENCRTRIRHLIKSGFKKSKRTETLIGTSYELFKEHLQSKFTPQMRWEHFMGGLIHIDHIIPLSSAKTQEEVEKLCHYTNLQPLWATTTIAREHGDMISIGNLEKSDGY